MNEVEAARGGEGKKEPEQQRAAQGHRLSPSRRRRKRLKIPSSFFFFLPSLSPVAEGGREGWGEKRECQIVGS